MANPMMDSARRSASIARARRATGGQQIILRKQCTAVAYMKSPSRRGSRVAFGKLTGKSACRFRFFFDSAGFLHVFHFGMGRL